MGPSTIGKIGHLPVQHSSIVANSGCRRKLWRLDSRDTFTFGRDSAG